MKQYLVRSRLSFAYVSMMRTLAITLCFTAVLAAYSIQGAASEMKKGFVMMKKGEILTIECNRKDNNKELFSLLARYPSKHVIVVYDEETKKLTLGEEYRERVKVSVSIHKLTIRISDLQVNDSGLYLGLYSKYVLEENKEEVEEGCSILLFVNDADNTIEKQSPLSEPLVLVFALTACTMLVVCFLVMWVLVPKVKALCVNQVEDQSREYNPVYEDMHRVQNK